MGKNIVILSGSPRKQGNTAQLIGAFQEGAYAAGNLVQVFSVAHKNIQPCIGCGYCIESPGECSLKDDMAEVLEALHAADVVVWASPVYYFSVTAQLKAAIDRTYPLVNERERKAALLLTCADESADTAEGALAIYKKTIDYYNWHDAGIVIATGVEDVGDICGHEALVLARVLGEEI